MNEKQRDLMKLQIRTEEQARRVEERVRGKLNRYNVNARPEHRISFEGLIRSLNLLWDAHAWTAAQALLSFYGLTHEDFYP